MHLKTNGRKGINITCWRDGRNTTIIIFDESQKQLWCHPSSRSSKERGADGVVVSRKFFYDLRKSEIRNDGISVLIHQDITLKNKVTGHRK
jgi:hypothetical protein